MQDAVRHWYDRFDSLPESPSPASAARRIAPEIGPETRSGPAVAAPRSGTRYAVLTRTGVAVAAVLCTLAFLAYPAARRYVDDLRLRYLVRYNAYPFFSLEAFRTLQPGMTEAAVRDRIGPPIDRNHAASTRIQWVYTMPKRGRSGPYLLCMAVFDPDTRRLVRVKEIALKHAPFSFPEWVHHVNLVSRSLRLIRPDATHRVLDSAHSLPCVILPGDPGWGPEEAKARLAGLAARLHALGVGECDFVYLYNESDANGTYDAWRASGLHPRIFTRSEPALGGPDTASLYIWAHGRLLALPPALSPAYANTLKEDQDWVLRHLLSSPSRRADSSTPS